MRIIPLQDGAIPVKVRAFPMSHGEINIHSTAIISGPD